MRGEAFERRLEDARAFGRACNGLADSRPDLSARSGLTGAQTFGLFLIVINAIMRRFAAGFTPGFAVLNWTAAIIGAFLLTVITTFLHWLIKDVERAERH